MKKLLLITAVLFLTIYQAQAQLPDLKSVAGSASALGGAGKLLSQFTDGIKPTAFLSSWTQGKAGWLASAGKIASAVEMARSVSSLAGFLKPEAFKSGFNVQSLIKTANTAKTMSSAAGVLKNLEGGLKPESLTPAWGEQRAGWLSALNLLK